ncbi:MAG: hypothetical protein IT170_07085 [Bryobacterales bacterium]|nr:hypothetical protein [Bryobacterales bacterium]
MLAAWPGDDSGSDEQDPIRSLELLHSLAAQSGGQAQIESTISQIRSALPEFDDWSFEIGKELKRYFSVQADPEDRIRNILPPGFADGLPGAFVKRSWTVVRVLKDGTVHNMVELLRDCADEESFRAVKNDIRLTHVLDLMWMVSGNLDLEAVQQRLSRIKEDAAPRKRLLLSPYPDTRYTQAFQAHFDGIPMRAAVGGLFDHWPGRPKAVSVAHIRLFLDAWTVAIFENGASQLGEPQQPRLLP